MLCPNIFCVLQASISKFVHIYQIYSIINENTENLFVVLLSVKWMTDFSFYCILESVPTFMEIRFVNCWGWKPLMEVRFIIFLSLCDAHLWNYKASKYNTAKWVRVARFDICAKGLIVEKSNVPTYPHIVWQLTHGRGNCHTCKPST